MNQLPIEMTAGTDKNGRIYYFATTSIPASINLERTVILVFPNGDEGARMIIKHHEPRQRRKEEESYGGSSDPG